MNLGDDIIRYREEILIHLTQMKEFYEMLDLKTAIEFASIGKNPNGKMNRHQWRVGNINGGNGAKELLKQEAAIKKCKTFEEIFEITEQVKKDIYKLGDLWSYDTALRIGFNLKLYPKEVYVQRGVISGVLKVMNGKRPKGRSLHVNIFPKEFQKLKPYEIENFLCIWGKDKKNSIC